MELILVMKLITCVDARICRELVSCQLAPASPLTLSYYHVRLLSTAFPPDWCSNIDSLKESFKMVNRLNWSSIEQSQFSGE